MANRNPSPKDRFRKGVSGNLEGGRKHNPEIKAIKRLTEAEMIEVGSLVLKGNIRELQLVLKDPTSSVLKCMMAGVAIKTIQKGDPHALDVLLNRLIGKVKERVEVTGIDAPKVIVNLPANGREIDKD